MLDLFNIPTPQTANYQEFIGGVVLSSTGKTSQTWVKPRGASMVRFLLIGPGGGGGQGSATVGGGGGGSGAVTSWIGPAMFVPDVLIIAPCYGGETATTGSTTRVYYQNTYVLLYASGGTQGGSAGGGGGTDMSPNQFTACGIFNTVAGQTGGAGSSTGSGSTVTASTTTFLSGGGGGAGSAAGTGGGVTPNYGYTALATTTAGGLTAAKNGYFITQPIMVGTGGAGGSTSTGVGTVGGRGGLGCGGGGAGEDALVGGRGGDGAVFIWAW